MKDQPYEIYIVLIKALNIFILRNRTKVYKKKRIHF